MEAAPTSKLTETDLQQRASAKPGLYKNILFLAVGVAVSLLTLWLAPYYWGGDQEEYHNAYALIAGMAYEDARFNYSNTLGGKEYVHFFLVWLASSIGANKEIVMSLSNGFLAYFSMRLFEKWRVSPVVAVAIILSNFYMVVLYFAAERLKFGFLFLVISMLYFGTPKRFYVFGALAILSHFQILLMYASMLFRRFFKSVIRFFLAFRFSLKNTILFVLLLVPLALVVEIVLPKIEYYQKMALQKSAFDLIRILLFFALSYWYSKNKNETLLIFIPLFVATYVVGGDRVNMMGYFVFLYYALQYRLGGILGYWQQQCILRLNQFNLFGTLLKTAKDLELWLGSFMLFRRWFMLDLSISRPVC